MTGGSITTRPVKRRRIVLVVDEGGSYVPVVSNGRILASLSADVFFGQPDRFRDEISRTCALWMSMRRARHPSANGIRQELRVCTCFLTHLLCAHGCVLHVEDPMHMLRLVRAANERVDAIAALCAFVYQNARDDYRDVVSAMRRHAPVTSVYRRQGLRKRALKQSPPGVWQEYFAIMSKSSDNMRTQDMYAHFMLHTRRVRGHPHVFWIDDTRMLRRNEATEEWVVQENSLI